MYHFCMIVRLKIVGQTIISWGPPVISTTSQECALIASGVNEWQDGWVERGRKRCKKKKKGKKKREGVNAVAQWDQQ